MNINCFINGLVAVTGGFIWVFHDVVNVVVSSYRYVKQCTATSYPSSKTDNW